MKQQDLLFFFKLKDFIHEKMKRVIRPNLLDFFTMYGSVEELITDFIHYVVFKKKP